MATFHLLCGLPGSGKTTLAREIEARAPALLLSPDPWMARVVRNGWDAKRREAVKALQLDLAKRALELGINVVSDAGFWLRRERDLARETARQAGADAQLHFLDVPVEELLTRLAARSASCPPDTFAVSPKQLAQMMKWFERPTPDELA
ncbi:MAG: AAA family ATPase [Caulobacteraceae bacterium]